MITFNSHKMTVFENVKNNLGCCRRCPDSKGESKALRQTKRIRGSCENKQTEQRSNLKDLPTGEILRFTEAYLITLQVNERDLGQDVAIAIIFSVFTVFTVYYMTCIATLWNCLSFQRVSRPITTVSCCYRLTVFLEQIIASRKLKWSCKGLLYIALTWSRAYALINWT